MLRETKEPKIKSVYDAIFAEGKAETLETDIRAICENFPELTDAEIAQMFKCDITFVTKVRARKN
jgi:hypothetical protein